jgi:ribosome assembly protein YihI (activator of Der GTPase)
MNNKRKMKKKKKKKVATHGPWVSPWSSPTGENQIGVFKTDSSIGSRRPFEVVATNSTKLCYFMS